jgi:hypothetical protein
MGYSSAAELLDTIVVSGSSTAAGSGISAGTAAAVGAGAAAGIGTGLAATSGSAGSSVPVNSAASPTGPSTSAAPGANPTPPSSNFFGNAVKSALVGSATNTALQAALGGRRGGVTVPPPPGAAMLDPEGAQAAAQLRARQAVAGGLNSTITGAGTNPGSFTSVTSGSKGLLGQ